MAARAAASDGCAAAAGGPAGAARAAAAGAVDAWPLAEAGLCPAAAYVALLAVAGG